MTQPVFAIGAKVSCTDGDCGKLIRVVLNPVARTVTHLVVEHWHERMHARLVPIELASADGSQIRLDCTKAEFDALPPAEERNFVAGSGHPDYASDDVIAWPYFSLAAMGSVQAGDGMEGDWSRGQGWDPGGSHGTARFDRRMADDQVGFAGRTYTYDSVPAGEVQVRRGDSVHATDGEIGVVEGLVLDPASHQVTHVLLREGHPWGRKEVAIPISAVTGVDMGIRLNLSKRQLEDLPPVEIDHSHE
jgi:hypothetical protein